jgi:hypothetical protein
MDQPGADADRRQWAVLGLLATMGLAVLAAALAAGALLARYFAEVDYPGAAPASDHTLYRLYPALTLRRTTSYRTQDSFPQVYNHYSSGFALGPEMHAQSGCILMARDSKTFYVLDGQMSVMLCDTPAGRLIFIMRSLTLSLR